MKKKIFEHNTEIEMKVAAENKGFLPVCGWHPNYFDFKYGKVKGTVTLIGGTLGMVIDGKYSFGISCEPLIKAALKEMKLHQRESKRKKPA